MKTFEVFFPCCIEAADGSESHAVKSSVQIEAADYGDAARKISAALQRLVDGPGAASGKLAALKSKHPVAPGGRTYKLRAECWVDTVRLLGCVRADRITIKRGLHGVEITLENPTYGSDAPMSLEDFRRLLRDKIVDSHVMVDSLVSVDPVAP